MLKLQDEGKIAVLPDSELEKMIVIKARVLEKETIKNSLQELQSQANKLSVQKCLTTTVLDDLAGKTRKYLIKETISLQATEDYKEILLESFA